MLTGYPGCSNCAKGVRVSDEPNPQRETKAVEADFLLSRRPDIVNSVYPAPLDTFELISLESCGLSVRKTR